MHVTVCIGYRPTYSRCDSPTAMNIKKMKDNKATGVDGIPPKQLKESEEQITYKSV